MCRCDGLGATRAWCKLMPLLVRALSAGMAFAVGAWSPLAAAQSPDDLAPPVIEPASASEAPTTAEPAPPDVPPPPPVPNSPDDAESGETLATPEVLSTPKVEVERPPTLAPNEPPAQSRPIRAQRRLVLTGEIGWNSLAGFGPNLTFHAHPHVSFDLGAGVGLVGRKVGLRARYNLLKSAVTPFIGVGGIFASGYDAGESPATTDSGVTISGIRPAAFVQGVVGVDWVSEHGFTIIGSAGYAWRVTRDNVKLVSGPPSREDQQALDFVFGSAPVFSIALGHAFR